MVFQSPFEQELDPLSDFVPKGKKPSGTLLLRFFLRYLQLNMSDLRPRYVLSTRFLDANKEL